MIEAAILISPIDFMVTEGMRTRARQAQLVKAGASRTMNSRHITGHAVELAALVEGQLRWDWPLYPRIAEAVKAAAHDLATPIVWGGDWTSLRDGPHFELIVGRFRNAGTTWQGGRIWRPVFVAPCQNHRRPSVRSAIPAARPASLAGRSRVPGRFCRVRSVVKAKYRNENQ